jgi:tRNA-Thr(GGU) m(6)t(6)A37 methyltransferase TsaA
MEINPVAIIENDYESKFAVPRQSGIAGLESKIIFEKEYSSPEAIRRLEGFSHLWLIWGFSENVRESHSLTVRPPRLGGNERVGVFASRSPFRPNNLGLSAVKLEKIETIDGSPVLTVSGADLINGTPIYDIKPYITFSDSIPQAKSGFVDSVEFPCLNVNISDELIEKIPKNKRDTLKIILENDPRPAYHSDSDRTYGFPFAGFEIRFMVCGDTLTVTEIENE